MIRFDEKNSANKQTFIKVMQYSGNIRPHERSSDSPWEQEKMLLSNTLKELEDTHDKNAVGLLNTLFMSSTSHVLDKVCLNIFSKLGDDHSLELLHKKYPTPETISISLLPYYIRVLQFLGGRNEVELLARLANTFWGLYRTEILMAFEDIVHRVGPQDISDEVVRALQYLYDTGDPSEKKKVVSLCPQFSHQLLLSVILCGIESEDLGVRKSAIAALGAAGGSVALSALRRAFQNETEEGLLEEYEKWLFSGTHTASTTTS